MKQGKKYQIFYTDDDMDDQNFFMEVVNEIDNGHDVHLQNHGEELMDLLLSPPPKPDVIFLDLNMPQKNGYEVLKEMRSDEKLSQIPVVVFSTSNNPESVSACEQLGASMYVCKPETYHSFKETLGSLLSMDWDNFSKRDRKNFVFTAN